MRGHKNHRRNVTAVVAVTCGLLALAAMPWRSAVGDLETNGASGQPACVIRDNAGKAVLNNNDALGKFLLSSGACPPDVFELRARLLAAGAKLKTTFVANRGFHNPGEGSFSMFEIVSGKLSPLGIEIADGEFLFGHFTGTSGSKLIANQQPDGLMVELIAWDPVKQVFNFYEVIGDGQRSQWFYRGDSLDIMSDVERLHRQAVPSRPQFGKRLRCSGCHTAGGPIMKELAAPHNDWSTSKRQLPFGPQKPDAELSRILKGLVDADELAASVKTGLTHLKESGKFQAARKARSLQEQLRPLFCPVELNLESDAQPLDDKTAQLTIPSGFFIDPRLARKDIAINRAHYDAALSTFKVSFPEISRADGDHGWLTPVKAFSDMQSVESLINEGLIDQEFAVDVLAVDMTNPVFSAARSSLLRLLPNSASADWQKLFKAALKANAKTNPAAQELLNNLTDPSRTLAFHQARAASFLEQCQKSLEAREAVIKLYQLLASRRAQAFASEISKNPRGQILEPGFRVIFPLPRPAIKAGSFQIGEDGRVIGR